MSEWRVQTKVFNYDTSPAEATTTLTLQTEAETVEAFIEDEAGGIVSQWNEHVTTADKDPLRKGERELIRQFLAWMYHGAPSPQQPSD